MHRKQILYYDDRLTSDVTYIDRCSKHESASHVLMVIYVFYMFFYHMVSFQL